MVDLLLFLLALRSTLLQLQSRSLSSEVEAGLDLPPPYVDRRPLFPQHLIQGQLVACRLFKPLDPRAVASLLMYPSAA